jgi:hypothetical protein
MLMMGTGSIWILIGIFNPEQVPLGLNCSRVVKANSAFVSQIQVQNLRDPGTALYTLSSQPALTESINWQQSYEATVEAFHHQVHFPSLPLKYVQVQQFLVCLAI